MGYDQDPTLSRDIRIERMKLKLEDYGNEPIYTKEKS